MADSKDKDLDENSADLSPSGEEGLSAEELAAIERWQAMASGEDDESSAEDMVLSQPEAVEKKPRAKGKKSKAKRIEGATAVAVLRFGADHDGRYLGDIVSAQRAQEGVAIHVRHVDIDHVQIDRGSLAGRRSQCGLQRFQSVGGFEYRVAGLFKDGALVEPNGGGIIHDEDVFHACSKGFW